MKLADLKKKVKYRTKSINSEQLEKSNVIFIFMSVK